MKNRNKDRLDPKVKECCLSDFINVIVTLERKLVAEDMSFLWGSKKSKKNKHKKAGGSRSPGAIPLQRVKTTRKGVSCRLPKDSGENAW